MVGLKRISADAGNQFTSRELKKEGQTCGAHLALAAPEHQEINQHVEVTWIMLRIIAHSLLIHARVSEAHINFALMYTTYNIFPVLPIKDLINEDIKPTTPFKLAIGMKPSVSHLRVLFCPCILRKATTHVDKKLLNMHHLTQKIFRFIFVIIP